MNYTDALIEEYTFNEKWYVGDDPTWERVWFSDSMSQFRQFILNTVREGKIKGLRANIAPDSYAAARASDLNHDMIGNTLCYLDIEHVPWSRSEHLTIGIPKCTDFEEDNLDNEFNKDYDEDDDFDGEFDPVDSYNGRLIADCGDFELSLYAFRSKQFPEHNSERTFDYFEGSETEKVFKPYIKRLYIYPEK